MMDAVPGTAVVEALLERREDFGAGADGLCFGAGVRGCPGARSDVCGLGIGV
ncbi:hypothetical protein [Tessaracoccus defluvii]|uniref:Uncharacterized protein n=1 Tax=Tessaracoccus defluvii TaxID=1285901 RepID=A0A7H0H6Y9_9ACTN|nr:hypothetical protein [Tessaracoccus defluvii]QNP56305.1 hypothetical protein H9L22_02180 [Tessaracoccus defluvii]